MFRRETDNLVRGSTLALTIDAMLDFAGDRTGKFHMISCEAQSHDAHGTPRGLFGRFFPLIADTMRQIPGADWTPEIDHARQNLLAQIERRRQPNRSLISFFRTRRQRLGEAPTFAENTLVKWLWSEKPHSSAISTTDIVELSRRFLP